MPSFPRPYVNDCKQDDSIMHYVRDGDFSHTDIGSRPSGMPKAMDKGRMDISHVGDGTPGPSWGGK
jgi:hypothetical protein